MLKAKVLIMVSIILMLCAGTACAKEDEPPKSNDYSVKELMREFPKSVENEHSIIDVDVSTLNEFFNTCATMKVRLRGMVIKYESAPSLILPSYTQTSCVLVCDGKEIRVFFESENEIATDGEYIEIIGEILSMSKPVTADSVSFTINNAKIIERGSSVKAQCETTK